MSENKIKKNKLKGLPSVRRGMTFVEAIIGIFIFSVVMFAVTNIFSSSFGGYKKADNMEKNIENAQYAMSVMTKSLRTSKITSQSQAFNNQASLTVYDYSTKSCRQYSFLADGTVMLKTKAVDPYMSGDCSDMGSGSNEIAGQYVYGSFSGTPSIDNVSPAADLMGKVTIRIKVCSEEGCPTGGKNDEATLQTTVSLRDYATVGL